MKEGKASWTAEVTAAFRAVESIRSSRERLLLDIYAEKFLRPTFRWLLGNCILARFVLWFATDRRFPGTIDTLVSRVRFVDDCLKECLLNGLEQLVILGAGYDSRAHRFAELLPKRVFEVDHPKTQSLKREKIMSMFGVLPRHVTYVAVDFEIEDLMEKLVLSGYRKDLKTLFIWEGVCKYLTAAAVDRLLAAVSANACRDSVIIFDYLYESVINGRLNSKLARKMLIFQASKGEPFIFGLPEEHPEDQIKSKGFSNVKNTTAAHIQMRYFSQQKRGRNMHPFWGVIEATV